MNSFNQLSSFTTKWNLLFLQKGDKPMLSDKVYSVKEAEKLVGLDRSTRSTESESGNLKTRR